MSSPSMQPAVISISSKEVEPDVRQEVAQSISRILAASVISNPSFPRRDVIPDKQPAAFVTLGHMPLLNYEWMLRRIWQVVGEIQEAIRKRKDKIKRARLTAFVIAASGVILLSVVTDPVFWVLVAFGGVLVYAISVAIGKAGLEPIHKTVAKIRADAIRNLILGGPEPPRNDFSDKLIEDPTLRGDGQIGQSQIPVLTIINDRHPFPGYGRLQGDNTFVCPPKDGKKLEFQLVDVRQRFSEKIKSLTESSGIRNVSIGEVVVIDGRSIPIDDNFLVSGSYGDKFPPLWCDKQRLRELEASSRSWCRIYTAIQVILPAYKTIATLFTRPFQAGNAMGYQIAVSTLGPPFEGGGDLLEAIQRYELGDTPVGSTTGEIFDGDASDNSQVTRLRAMRELARRGPNFQIVNVDIDAIEKLTPILSPEVEKRSEHEAKKMLGETMFWPAYSSSTYNFREIYSSTFTTEFFGKPEGLATVRTLYLQISRAILESLDSLEYDISDYKNEKGAIVVNAAKIDQLVMGERVSVSKDQKPEAQPNAS